MKLVSFADASGSMGFGRVEGDQVIQLGAGPWAVEHLGRLPQLQPLDRWSLASVRLLAPMSASARILAIGVNYDEHRKEMGREVPKHPVVFTRFADSVVGPGDAILRPPESEQLDFEGELAVIIGKAGRRIPKESALEWVLGYSCFNDGTIRDWQKHTHQFTPGKNFSASGSIGPWIVTSEELPDPHALLLTTRVSGEVMQEASTGEMLFKIPELIHYLSTFMTLQPGDVIATGTPAGVGAKRNPPRFLRHGDRVEVTISGIGTLSNPIRDEVG